VLAVDTTEAKGGDGRSRTDIFLVASEALVRLSYIPLIGRVEVWTGGVEPPQPEATRLQRGELAYAQRPRGVRVADRVRTGADGAHNPGCFRLHHGHHEAGTTGLEPAASRLTSERSAQLSYAPEK